MTKLHRGRFVEMLKSARQEADGEGMYSIDHVVKEMDLIIAEAVSAIIHSSDR
jgi:hypothetical protein